MSKPAVPKEYANLNPRHEMNFVKQNQRNIANEHYRPIIPQSEVMQNHKNFGKVPEYLNKF